MDDRIWAFWKGGRGGWTTLYGLSGRGIVEDGRPYMGVVEDGKRSMSFKEVVWWRMEDHIWAFWEGRRGGWMTIYGLRVDISYYICLLFQLSAVKLKSLLKNLVFSMLKSILMSYGYQPTT